MKMKKTDFLTIENVKPFDHIYVRIDIGDNTHSVKCWRLDKNGKGYTVKEAVKEAWNTMPPIACYANGLGGYDVLGIHYGIDDYLVLRDYETITVHKIYYTTRDYIIKHGKRLYLADMLRYER